MQLTSRFIIAAAILMLTAMLLPAAEPPLSTTATIAANESASSAIDLAERTPVAIIMPDTWTSAGVGFRASRTFTGTYVPLYVGSTSVTTRHVLQAGASRIITLDPKDFYGVRYLKIESAATSDGASVNQAAERILYLVYRRVNN